MRNWCEHGGPREGCAGCWAARARQAEARVVEFKEREKRLISFARNPPLSPDACSYELLKLLGAPYVEGESV